jgi:putative ABC transport system permease protein
MTSDFARLASEIVLAGRRLRRATGFVIASIVLLAAGLGVGTTLFNIANAVLLKPYDTARPFVRISYDGSTQWSVLPREVAATLIAEPPISIEQLAGHSSHRVSAVFRRVPTVVQVDSVAGPYFTLAAVQPLLGRLLETSDDLEANPAVALVSEQLWRMALAADPSVLGESIVVAGQPLTIVGVLPASFKGVIAQIVGTDVWVSTRTLPAQQLFGTLKPGIGVSEATTELSVRRFQVDANGERARLQVLEGLLPRLPKSGYALVSITLAIGIAVAAIAAVSLACLLVARVDAFRGDIAMRLALGAGTGDVVRPFAVEIGFIAVVAALLGGWLGAALAHGAGQYLASVTELGTLALDVSPDWRVAIYVGLTTAALALAVVTYTVRDAARIDALSVMSTAAGAGGVSPRIGGRAIRLIVLQVSAVVGLLFVATVFGRSVFTSLGASDRSDVNSVAIGWIDQSGAKGDSSRARQTNRRILQRALEAPGIVTAALSSRVPGGDSSISSKARSSASDWRWVQVHSITCGLFDVLRLPVRRGRTFTAAEEAAQIPVAVVSESTAAALWGSANPIGDTLLFQSQDGARPAFEVIGVVADAAPGGTRRERDTVFIPTGHRDEPAMALLVRSAGASLDAVHTLERLNGQPDLPGLLSVRTMAREMAGSAGPATLVTLAVTLLGITGLFIAVAGLYGLTAQCAVQRRREMAIRQALGATNATICRMLAAESAKSVAGGILPGLLLGVLGAYAAKSVFGDIEPLDAGAALATAGAMIAAGLLGTLLPFRRLLTDAAGLARSLGSD